MSPQSLECKSNVILTATKSFVDKHIRSWVRAQKAGGVPFFCGKLKLNLINMLRKLQAKLKALFGTDALVFYVSNRRFVWFRTGNGPASESIELLLYICKVRL